MDEYFDAVREELAGGAVSAQALVLLFNALWEAEQRQDAAGLEEALGLARDAAAAAGPELREEADRLVSLCEDRLREVAAQPDRTEPTPSAAAHCPGCGREVDSRAVRCRACGELLP
jgi:hypothetical protein